MLARTRQVPLFNLAYLRSQRHWESLKGRNRALLALSIDRSAAATDMPGGGGLPTESAADVPRVDAEGVAPLSTESANLSISRADPDAAVDAPGMDEGGVAPVAEEVAHELHAAKEAGVEPGYLVESRIDGAPVEKGGSATDVGSAARTDPLDAAAAAGVDVDASALPPPTPFDTQAGADPTPAPSSPQKPVPRLLSKLFSRRVNPEGVADEEGTGADDSNSAGYDAGSTVAPARAAAAPSPLLPTSKIRWQPKDMEMRTSLAVAVCDSDTAESVAATLDLRGFIRQEQGSTAGVQGVITVIGDSDLLDRQIAEHDGRVARDPNYVEHFGGLTAAVTKTEASSRLSLMFSRGLARAAESVHAAVFTAGIDRGPVAYMGRAAMDRGNKMPVVGVVPMSRATWPGDPRPNHGAKGRELRLGVHPGHSHVVMAATDDEVGARQLRFRVIEAVLARNARGAGPLPVVGVLVSGAEAAIEETLACVRRGWPLVIVKGTGGAADAIAWASQKENANHFVPNPKVRATNAPARNLRAILHACTRARSARSLVRRARPIQPTDSRRRTPALQCPPISFSVRPHSHLQPARACLRQLMEIVRSAVIEVISIADADGKILQAMLERLFKTMLARGAGPGKEDKDEKLGGDQKRAKGVRAALMGDGDGDDGRVRLPPVEDATGASVMVHQAIAIFESNSARLGKIYWYMYASIQLLAVFIVVLVSVRNDSVYARVSAHDANTMDHIIFFTPIANTILVSINQKFQYGLKAKILTAAAQAMRKELYTYRSRVEAFVAAQKCDAILAERYQIITDRLQSTLVGEVALDRSALTALRNTDYRVSEDDDGFSVLAPDSYIKMRAEPAMLTYQTSANMMDSASKTISILVILMSASGTAFAIFGLNIYIAVTTAVSSALLTLTESLGYEPKIIAANRASGKMLEVIGWWRSRTAIEQANPQKFSKLVRVCERAMSNQRRSTNPGAPMVETEGTNGELNFNLDEFMADVSSNTSEGSVAWGKVWMGKYPEFFEIYIAWLCNTHNMKLYDGDGDPMVASTVTGVASSMVMSKKMASSMRGAPNVGGFATSPAPSPPLMASLPPSPPFYDSGDEADMGSNACASHAHARALALMPQPATPPSLASFASPPPSAPPSDIDPSENAEYVAITDYGTMVPPLPVDTFFADVPSYVGETEKVERIVWDPTLFGARASFVVEPDPGTHPEEVERMLKLSSYISEHQHTNAGVHGLIKVIGASSALDDFVAGELPGQRLPDGISPEETIARLQMVYSRGIMAAAEQVHAVVMSGGWDVGPAGYAGYANRDREYRVPLVAVNAKPKMTWPGDVRPGQRDRLPLQPDHTHVVLLPTDDEAAISKYRFDLADAIARDDATDRQLPAVAFLVNGAQPALMETLECVRKGWPLVCIKGSGGVADRLYKARQAGHTYMNDSAITEIVQEANIEFIELSEVDGGTTSQMIKRLFFAQEQQLKSKNTDDPTVRLAWERFGEYSHATDIYKGQSKWLRNSFLSIGVVITAVACTIEAIRGAGLAEATSTGWSVTLEDWLEHAVIIAPIVLAVISAISLKLRAKKKAAVLKLAAERIRSQIYRWRTRTGEYAAVTVSDRATELDRSVQKIQQEVLASVVAEGALSAKGGNVVRKSNCAVSDVDNGVSTLSPEDYIELRLGPIVADFERKAKQITFYLALFNVLNYVLGGMGTVLAVFRQTRLYVAVSVAVASSLVTVAEESRFGEKLLVYNRSLTKIRNLLGWWLSLTDIEKSNPQKFAKLVDEVETACMEELSVLAMNVGDDDEQNDSAPSLDLHELRQDIAEAADASGKVIFKHNWCDKHPIFFHELTQWLQDERIIEPLEENDIVLKPPLTDEIRHAFLMRSVIGKKLKQAGREAVERWLAHADEGGTLEDWTGGSVRGSDRALKAEARDECVEVITSWGPRER